MRSLLLVLLLVSSTVAWSQNEVGAIEGVVKDRADAAFGDATVVLVNLSTLECSRSRSDGSGGYRFADLRPGRYQVLVGASGFATKVRVLKVMQGKVTKFSPRLSAVEVKN